MTISLLDQEHERAWEQHRALHHRPADVPMLDGNAAAERAYDGGGEANQEWLAQAREELEYALTYGRDPIGKELLTDALNTLLEREGISAMHYLQTDGLIFASDLSLQFDREIAEYLDSEHGQKRIADKAAQMEADEE